MRLLRTWQKRINLVADSTLEQAWERHLLDSAQLWPHLPAADARIADIGSGAGFPGLVLAILGARDVHLIERDVRKCAFLREAARLTDTRVTLHPISAEAMDGEKFDVVTSRACAPLAALCALSFPLLRRDGICLFLKGKNYSTEEERTHAAWEYDRELFPSLTEEEGRILLLRRLRPRESLTGNNDR